MLREEVLRYIEETEVAAMQRLDEREKEFGEIGFQGLRPRIREVFKDAKELVRLFGKDES